jgi:hypothetical protein
VTVAMLSRRLWVFHFGTGGYLQMRLRRETEEKIKIIAGVFIIACMITAVYYPMQSLCVGFAFLMIAAWVLQLLGGGPRSRR